MRFERFVTILDLLWHQVLVYKCIYRPPYTPPSSGKIIHDKKEVNIYNEHI